MKFKSTKRSRGDGFVDGCIYMLRHLSPEIEDLTNSNRVLLEENRQLRKRVERERTRSKQLLDSVIQQLENDLEFRLLEAFEVVVQNSLPDTECESEDDTETEVTYWSQIAPVRGDECVPAPPSDSECDDVSESDSDGNDLSDTEDDMDSDSEEETVSDENVADSDCLSVSPEDISSISHSSKPTPPSGPRMLQVSTSSAFHACPKHNSVVGQASKIDTVSVSQEPQTAPPTDSILDNPFFQHTRPSGPCTLQVSENSAFKAQHLLLLERRLNQSPTDREVETIMARAPRVPGSYVREVHQWEPVAVPHTDSKEEFTPILLSIEDMSSMMEAWSRPLVPTEVPQPQRPQD